jgi:peptide/nickel transport system substrate-binding protein
MRTPSSGRPSRSWATAAAISEGRRGFHGRPRNWGIKPAIDRVVCRIIPDDLARVAALQAGEVQVIVRVPPGQVSALGAGLTVEKAVANVVNTFMVGGIKKGSGPLSDKRVRQAIAYAID